MPLFNKMLNIMPHSCLYCDIGLKGMQHVSSEALQQGLHLTELMRGEAEKIPVWNALANEDPIFVNGFGHGSYAIYTGDTVTPIFTSTDCHILSGRVVYLLSCYTANELGPAVIEAGGIAYGGYKIDWTWMMWEFGIDPYTDRLGEGFYRSSNEFPITLIHGENVAIARDKCIAEYNRWIKIWETERSDDEFAADTIKWLIWDRDGLTVLGDLSATIITTGIVATMTVEYSPPKYVKEAGQTFPFAGKLLAYETREPLPDRQVSLWKIGEETPIASTTTDNEGRWGFDIALDKGVHLIYVKFLGDTGYSLASSITYRIEVGIILPKIFGTEIRGWSHVVLPANQIRGTWFTCTERGIADSITFWLDKKPPEGTRIRYAIYKKSDGSLVGYTEERVSPPEGWLTLNIVSGGGLDFGDYWLDVWSDNPLSVLMHEAADRAGVHFQEYDSFPDFVSPQPYDHIYGVYCTFTPTPFLPEHALTVNSSPVSGIPVKVDDISVGDTPTVAKLIEGEHKVEVPREVVT